ncbi:MAG: RNA polymerase sigma factor [Phenylobacterium sp.]|jgi:RNA polymerase sigma-70 factor (ECF subfamily)|uniref:RNA polymerase sigma factor n=1 Tax=Phenylobacterium sp. TaxID=1871053 RepID=UPI0025EF1282|nr:RNA polymerase sigma factor [Phenylobacterium sp.]MBI1197897.1 RNA polymerase sigma factor [Phenylobacterium sp.]
MESVARAGDPAPSQSYDGYSQFPEAQLTGLAVGGDPLAFREIMLRANPRLFRVARSIMRDEGEAEDVVQEAYLRAFAALDRFRGDSGLTTWLTRIVINEANGRLRRKRARVSGGSTHDHPGDAPSSPANLDASDGETPEEAAARSQARRLIEIAIDELPLPFRMVFFLREVEQFTIGETAALLGIAPDTVKTRLFRARRRLRRSLCSSLAGGLNDVFPFQGERCERMTRAVLARLDVQPRHGG